MTLAARVPEVVGSETPRIWTPPDRELTPETSLGFSVIKFSQNILGIDPYPWQKWLYIHALELNDDGSLRFSEIHLLVARQNGKTRWVKTLILWRMFAHQPSNLVLGAAQNRDYALATWAETKAEALDIPILAKRMRRGSMKSGNETVQTVAGARYMVVTLKDDAGRSKTAGTLFLDELREHETWGAWNALSSTTLVVEDSLIVGASNAGDVKSVVLRAKREYAHGQITRGQTEASPLGWFEWSAPDGCDLDDIAGWRQANPSLGHSMTLDALKAQRSKPDNAFRTENLCQWVDMLQAGIIPEVNWQYAKDRTSRREAGTVAAASVDVSWDRSHAAVAVAFRRPDGRVHVEVVAYRVGLAWVARWFKSRLTVDARRAEELGLPGPQTGPSWFDGRVALQGRGCPATALVDPLTEAGVEVVPLVGPAVTLSAGVFYDRVVNEGDPEHPVIVHRGQPILDESIRGTLAKTTGDAWLLDRRESTSDASPLVACVQAVWLLDQPRPEVRRSAYDDGATFEVL